MTGRPHFRERLGASAPASGWGEWGCSSAPARPLQTRMAPLGRPLCTAPASCHSCGPSCGAGGRVCVRLPRGWGQQGRCSCPHPLLPDLVSRSGVQWGLLDALLPLPSEEPASAGGLVGCLSSEVTFISRITHYPQYFLCSQSLAGSSSSGNSPVGILTPLPRFCGTRSHPRIAASSRLQSPHQLRPATRAASPCRGAGSQMEPGCPVSRRPHLLCWAGPAHLSELPLGQLPRALQGGQLPCAGWGQQVPARATCLSFPLGVKMLRVPSCRPEMPARAKAEMAGTRAVDGRRVSPQLTC